MSEKSIIGSMPWLNRFRPSVTRQTLPVRSPLPNRQPSTRSAPAIRASSASATAVPRSLWVWTDRQTLSRRVNWRLIHSIWSAYTLEVDRSTVQGRLKMISRPGFGLPEVGHGLADLDGEVELGVHEDLGRILVAEIASPRAAARRAGGPRSYRRWPAPWSARGSCRTPRGGTAGRSALYRWTVARGAPTSDSTVRSMRSSRAWVSTEICTSSGMRSPSMSSRTKSKSVWLADGKPTSISL